MNYILFEQNRANLQPITYTKPISEIRIGILKIREKWELYLKTKISNKTENYLSKKFPMIEESENIFINSRFIPNDKIIEKILKLKKNQTLITPQNTTIAYNGDSKSDISKLEKIIFSEELIFIENVWDLFLNNKKAIEIDFKQITKGRKSQKISSTNNIINPQNIFLEKGSSVEFATLNPTNGYIYVGKNATIMENSTIRGSLALCDNATIKIGAVIYDGVTIGKYSKAAGEISESIISDFSNKGHDGYMGNSIIGNWCNIGAGTITSNLKNDYSKIKLWDYKKEGFVKTGEQFCGLIMGDYSKAGIMTMFNTATVVGICSNVFGSDFPRNFIPSFSWGGHGGFIKYKMEKAIEAIQRMMERRNKTFTNDDKMILKHVSEMTKRYRRY